MTGVARSNANSVGNDNVDLAMMGSLRMKVLEVLPEEAAALETQEIQVTGMAVEKAVSGTLGVESSACPGMNSPLSANAMARS